MTADLETGSEFLVYGGRSYSRDRLQTKLTADLASYRRCQEELSSREQLLEAKERSLEATREQLATMRDQKRELEVQIAQLEAELKTVRLAQSRCKFQLDDSRLAEIKASLADVRNRLKVEAKTAELQGEFANDAIPVERKQQSADEVIREVHNYFGNNGKVAVEQE
jgi:chromosome segregation ATPase